LTTGYAHEKSALRTEGNSALSSASNGSAPKTTMFRTNEVSQLTLPASLPFMRLRTTLRLMRVMTMNIVTTVTSVSTMNTPFTTLCGWNG